MKLKAMLVTALVAAFATQGAVAETNFNGYLRSGSGMNSNGGAKIDCFSVKGGVALAAGDISNAGRLGAECGTYGELQFGTTLGETEGTKFDIQTMLATGVDQVQDWESANFGFRQAYARATGFGNGALAKADVWIGKRYYDRHDVHIVDFFWMADTGPGAGIENIDLGFGKFSYALMRSGANLDPTVYGTTGYNSTTGAGIYGQSSSKHDFRLQGVDLGSVGSLGVGAIIVRGTNTTAVDSAISAAGVQKDGVSAWLSLSKAFGGVSNNLVYQMSNGAANFDGTTLLVKNNEWRLFDSINFEFGDNWNGAAFIAYGKADQTTPDILAVPASYTLDSKTGVIKPVALVPLVAGSNSQTTDSSIVVRPVYHFTEKYSLAVEAGTTLYSTDGAATNHLTKLTIAPQISMGSGFYSRPVLRAYYTMASWNKGGATPFNGNYQANGGTYTSATDTSGSSLGVQMEAWW